MNVFAEWWDRYRRRRRDEHAALGDRVGDAPTQAEMAARAAELERENAKQRELINRLTAEIDELNARALGGSAPLMLDQIRAFAHVVEEAGEIVRAGAKVLQHGLEWRSSRKGRGLPARIQLESELGDLLAALEPLYETGDLRRGEISRWRAREIELRPADRQAAAAPAQGSGQGQ